MSVKEKLCTILGKDSKPDILSEEEIRLAMKKDKVCKFVVMESVDSTNSEMKRRAAEGAKEGLVVLTEQQTAGRGRLGRSFLSPPGTGIYMSVLLKPSLASLDAIRITTAASVAVVRAIRNITGLAPTIKWVNDIYLGGKKLCGILTEAVTDSKTGSIDSVVLGIGINYKEPSGGFPKDLKEVACALKDETVKVSRNQLIAAVLDEFFVIYQALPEHEYMLDYRKWSNVIGHDVKFLEKGVWYFAKAIGIDDDGGLVVEMEDGNSRILRTGEITLRKLR